MQNLFKSADELDCDTGRVVIVSALKNDDRDCVMGNNHNLILDIKENEKIEGDFFDNLSRFFKKVIEIGRGDSLH